jgi:hypothetical protein
MADPAEAVEMRLGEMRMRSREILMLVIPFSTTPGTDAGDTVLYIMTWVL